MTLEEFDQLCESFPNTTRVVQWGDAHVWKIGEKVFAIGGWYDGNYIGVTFKCAPEMFQYLKEKPGIRPAPYLASRGFSWLQWIGPETISEENLAEHLWESYRLVCAGLTKAKRREIGVDWGQ